MSFEPSLLTATAGMGANLVLNCLYGKQLQASLRCVAEFGRFIQLGKLDIEHSNNIGMRVFLRNVSLYTVYPENIFRTSQAEKKLLFELVKEGIENLAVKPLPRKMADHQSIPLVLR